MKLKSIILLIIMIALLCTMADGALRRGHTYSSTSTWVFYPGKTVANPADTQTNVFKFTQLGAWEKIVGWIYVEVTAVDTNTGGEYVDTTKDSMSFTLYTACKDNPLITKVMEFDSLIYQGNQDTIWFTIPADSSICDELYFTFETVIGDSDHSVTDSALGVTYKATVYMTAK